MRLIDRYPIIVTSRLQDCRDFWQRLGFAVAFEASWFVLLQSSDGDTALAFMSPDHPSAPPGPQAFSGTGVCFELQVEDIDEAYEELVRAGLSCDYPVTTEPFGQIRLGFFDPSGLWVDVVQQVDSAPGFWEQYAPPDDPGN